MTPATAKADEAFIDVVGFDGGSIISENATAADEAHARAAVELAYGCGIRFFDIADCSGTGRSESLIGDALMGRRSQVRLCTMGGFRSAGHANFDPLRCDASYPALRACLEDSLVRLCTDHVDVYLLHHCDPELSPEEQMENLQRLRDDGLADEVGFCSFPVAETARALSTGIPSVVQYRFNLLDHRSVIELTSAGQRGCTRVTFDTYAQGLLCEHPLEIGPLDQAFVGGAPDPVKVGMSKKLAAVAARAGLSLAALVVAITVRQPHTDIVLIGGGGHSEVEDALKGLGSLVDDAVLAEVGAVLATVEQPSQSLIGLLG